MKVLITGAESGIGFLTGITLSDRGHIVYMTTHTEKGKENLIKKIDAMSIKNVNIFKLDITSFRDRNKILELDIDVLINHAGIGVGGSIIDLDINKVKENFNVNFFDSFDLVKIFCNSLINNNKKGKIIITSSIAGVMPIEFLGSYCSSKAAITTMAACLRKELKMKTSDIQISVIEPGAYKTGFNEFMIDTIDLSIDKNSYFYDISTVINNKLTKIFTLIEKKNINSIVCKIVKSVEDKNNKFIYTAPLLQVIAKKIYLLFFR